MAKWNLIPELMTRECKINHLELSESDESSAVKSLSPEVFRNFLLSFMYFLGSWDPNNSKIATSFPWLALGTPQRYYAINTGSLWFNHLKASRFILVPTYTLIINYQTLINKYHFYHIKWPLYFWWTIIYYYYRHYCYSKHSQISIYIINITYL